MWTNNLPSQTEEMSNIRYEWETKKASLDFEIGKLESQLRSVEKRTNLLKLDVTVSALCVVIPYCILLFTSILSTLFYASGTLRLFGALLDGSYIFLLEFYILSLPFSIYHVIKGILMYYYHKKEDTTWQKPHLRSDYGHRNQEREASYQTEKDKLNWILIKYYAYRNEMEQMKKDMENDDLPLTCEEVTGIFDRMEYYEEIKPANPFTGVLVKKTRRITIFIFVAFLLVIYLTVIAPSM